MYDTLRRVDDPTLVGFSQARLDAIDDYVEEQVDNGGPSLAISVVKDGAITKESAYGYAKKYDTPLVDGVLQPARELPRDEWQPAGVDTMYDLASNTKMYATNYAIQQLVSEGVLDLDRTLQSFPGWEDYTDAATQYTGDWVVGGRGGIDQAYAGKSTITVADLLHHTAGELPDPQYQNARVAGGLYYQSADIRDRSGIIDVICRTPLIASPHTEFRYSDVDYMILGLLVEQLTRQSLDTYLQEHFYGPLGLHRTTFNPLLHGFTKQQTAATELNGNTRDGHVSFGSLPDGMPAPIRHNTLQGEVHDEKGYYSMGGVSGHAGLFSTVGDLAVLTQLMLNGGLYNGRQYFTREVTEQFTAPYALDAADVDSSTIGLGWRLQSASGDGYRYFTGGPSRSSYGHSGWTGTLTVIDPAHNMTITILTNMRHSPVVDPPNGFAASRFPIAELTPVVARVYSALLADIE
ncbi:penicillin binding protein PBP4B [Rathayibacter soli]|uniref:penicillin binding protein PBP4B n=1 Tax=Rathayibacter soli TaxID=3144168 RepID=UPI0027E56D94|nr:penicillin binding protein PBP4B [Glaciibacter superstes]